MNTEQIERAEQLIREEKAQEAYELLLSLAKEDPDLDQTASQTVGGLGIFMVKKSMDHIAYEYIDGQNVLTIRKNI